jgi:hypothetical protein
VTVEEAEGLLAWLLAQPGARVDLAGCTHCHAAVLQLLMAAAPRVAAWPDDAGLAAWLRPALPASHS